MRSALSLVIGIGITLTAAGVAVFHFWLALPWIDALYFAVTTVTTVGYGDYNLQTAPSGVKLFGCMLMLAGTASLAAAIALINDALFEVRLENLFGKRKRLMHDHIILCGLGHVGIRVVATLQKLGERIVVIDPRPEPRLVDEAKALGVEVVVDDLRNPAVLDRANVKHARSVIAASDDDLANLEVALNARAAAPGIRVVLRMFDADLARKVGAGFGINATFSTSALSAPALALAALEPGILGSLPIGDELVLSMELEVEKGSRLDGMRSTELKRLGSLAIISYESRSEGVRRFHPQEDFTIAFGDKIIVSIKRELCPALAAWNKGQADA